MVESVIAVSRPLSRSEKIALLKRYVEFLQEAIAEMQQRIGLLIDDNAELDYLADLDTRVGIGSRFRAAGLREEEYLENARRIRELEDDVALARRRLELYRDVLREQFGVSLADPELA